MSIDDDLCFICGSASITADVPNVFSSTKTKALQTSHSNLVDGEGTIIFSRSLEAVSLAQYSNFGWQL